MVLYSRDEPWANGAPISVSAPIAGLGYDNINFSPLITMLFFKVGVALPGLCTKSYYPSPGQRCKFPAGIPYVSDALLAKSSGEDNCYADKYLLD